MAKPTRRDGEHGREWQTSNTRRRILQHKHCKRSHTNRCSHSSSSSSSRSSSSSSSSSYWGQEGGENANAASQRAEAARVSCKWSSRNRKSNHNMSQEKTETWLFGVQLACGIEALTTARNQSAPEFHLLKKRAQTCARKLTFAGAGALQEPRPPSLTELQKMTPLRMHTHTHCDSVCVCVCVFKPRAASPGISGHVLQDHRDHPLAVVQHTKSNLPLQLLISSLNAKTVSCSTAPLTFSVPTNSSSRP